MTCCSTRSGGGLQLHEINNASRAPHASTAGPTHFNFDIHSLLFIATAHGPVFGRAPAPVVSGAPTKAAGGCCLC
jgi:hypothetical protein